MSFVPGHVSITFAVKSDIDPLKMGSTGFGLVLSLGVYCAVVNDRPSSEDAMIVCDGSAIEDPVTLRALEIVGFSGKGHTIYFRRDLPLGYGLGISGASALAACLEVEKDLDKSVRAAHQAEVEFKTGLGDVMAISASLRSNLFPAIVIRKTPGYKGKVSALPANNSFGICLSGLGLETTKILKDCEWIELINSAFAGIKLQGTNIRSVIKMGRIFSDKAGLITPEVLELLERVPFGTVATVAHLGTSIIYTSNDMVQAREALQEYGEIIEF